MKNKLKKVAVVGPECTGKSELCTQLAQAYDTVYVPEFAREFLIEKNNQYNYDDMLFIIDQQLKLESTIEKTAKDFLFIDNDFINIKIWMREVFNRDNDFLNKLIITAPYDLYILCNIDVTWQKDLLRSNDYNRAYLYEQFEKELQAHQLPYIKLSGLGVLRKENAIKIIDSYFY